MWFHSLLASWKSGLSRSRRPQPRPARRGTRLVLEHLEDRALPSSYSAASVSALIADINAANTAGGANTITLTAPTTSPYVLTAVNNTTNGGTDGNGLPVIAANDNLTIVGNGDTIERSTASGTLAFRLFDVAPRRLADAAEPDAARRFDGGGYRILSTRSCGQQRRVGRFITKAP